MTPRTWYPAANQNPHTLFSGIQGINAINARQLLEAVLANDWEAIILIALADTSRILTKVEVRDQFAASFGISTQQYTVFSISPLEAATQMYDLRTWKYFFDLMKYHPELLALSADHTNKLMDMDGLQISFLEFGQVHHNWRCGIASDADLTEKFLAVGEQQRRLPAHLLHEFCRPGRNWRTDITDVLPAAHNSRVVVEDGLRRVMPATEPGEYVTLIRGPVDESCRMIRANELITSLCERNFTLINDMVHDHNVILQLCNLSVRELTNVNKLVRDSFANPCQNGW